MNIETKYLIRWGIPGWILILTLGPYLYFSFEEIRKLPEGLLAVGAILTVIGVPLGYILNQIHHSVTWVIVRWRILHKIFGNEKWDEYFEKEIKLDEIFFKDDEGKKKQERYRYLLTRKHELGGVTVSLAVSCFTILLINFTNNNTRWSWIYFAVVFIIFIIISISRTYSSRNVEWYFREYLDGK